jgi:uncharacterized protein (TIGR01777 family)
MPTVLLAGGTGTIGKRLHELLLQKGYEVIILSRNEPKGKIPPGTRYARWNIVKGEIDKEAITGCDHIINLAGESLAATRWTPEQKNTIIESRVQTCALLVNALYSIPNKVQSVISASASGYYGPDNPQSLTTGFTEDDPPATDFLGEVCQQWEESIEAVSTLGKRLVILRTGIVLSKKGGALAEFTRSMKFGVAAILGSGKQIISWIHEDDICNMYLYALENEAMAGAYNAVAPHPVSNRKLTMALAHARKKFVLPVHVPGFALRLALGELSTEVLKSANLSAGKIENAGFTFRYPDINMAADQLMKND